MDSQLSHFYYSLYVATDHTPLERTGQIIGVIILIIIALLLVVVGIFRGFRLKRYGVIIAACTCVYSYV